MKAIGYIRVSTDEQQYGPEAQRTALAAWCAAHGAELAEVHEDIGVSGGAALEERPGLVAAVDAVQDKTYVLLVAKRDRLARDVIVGALVERLVERRGGRIVSADGAGNGDGPEAQLMRRIVDAFAEYERALIRARTRAAMQTMRRAGRYTGGRPPYGTRRRDDGVLEVEPGEARVVAAARALCEQGLSLSAAARALQAVGMVSRTGRPFQAVQVRAMVRSA